MAAMMEKGDFGRAAIRGQDSGMAVMTGRNSGMAAMTGRYSGTVAMMVRDSGVAAIFAEDFVSEISHMVEDLGRSLAGTIGICNAVFLGVGISLTAPMVKFSLPQSGSL